MRTHKKHKKQHIRRILKYIDWIANRFVGKLWKALNANQNQIGIVCRNVTKIFHFCLFYFLLTFGRPYANRRTFVYNCLANAYASCRHQFNKHPSPKKNETKQKTARDVSTHDVRFKY